MKPDIRDSFRASYGALAHRLERARAGAPGYYRLFDQWGWHR